MSTTTRRTATRRGRVFLAGAVAAATAWVALAGPAAAAPPAAPAIGDGPTAAVRGAGWLATQLDAGIPLQVFGKPDWGTTIEAALALAQTGVGSDRVATVWAALVADRDAVVAPAGADDPGRLARAVLLADLTGADPHAVGAAPGADLVARLAATRRTSGADTGLFGPADPTYDGAFRQGLALAALRAVGEPADPSALAWLEAQQCADGSWMPYRSDLSAPCAFDASLFVGPDSNSTALAVVGLASAPGAAATAGVDWLRSDQNADGGWGFYPGDPSDPNSTALASQALLTLGAAPARDPLPSLLSFQVDCDGPPADLGGFASAFSQGFADLLATVQAVPAAAGRPIPGVAGEAVEGTPSPDCDGGTTTTSTSTTTTSTTTPTTTTTAPGGSTTTTTSTTPTVAAATVGTGSGGAVVLAATVTPSGAPAATSSVAAGPLALTGDDPSAAAAAGALALVAGLSLLVVRRRLRPVAP